MATGHTSPTADSCILVSVETPVQPATLSVAIITLNEEANLRRTLQSVSWADEIVVVDSGSTDRTCAIAREYGAKVFVEPWKGFAAQKHSALDKCTSEWILSLDADEEVGPELAGEIRRVLASLPLWEQVTRAGWEALTREAPGLPLVSLSEALRIGFDQDPEGFYLGRRNHFLGRWIRRGGFYPDRKLRLVRRGAGRVTGSAVHEVLAVQGGIGILSGDLVHHAYPTLSGYIEHMNRYSSLGAGMIVEKKGKVRFSVLNIILRPIATFLYNYFLRLGFLDGKEGLLLQLYHSVYVSWKYAKAWEVRGQRLSGK
jgi:glycosyltransferase involved in cell wall biosynthesis